MGNQWNTGGQELIKVKVNKESYQEMQLQHILKQNEVFITETYLEGFRKIIVL